MLPNHGSKLSDLPGFLYIWYLRLSSLILLSLTSKGETQNFSLTIKEQLKLCPFYFFLA